ncbi:MAG: hypothetical protein ACO3YX_07015, partial [Candidatus Nanopelagicaceae bacterium]
MRGVAAVRRELRGRVRVRGERRSVVVAVGIQDVVGDVISRVDDIQTRFKQVGCRGGNPAVFIVAPGSSEQFSQGS